MGKLWPRSPGYKGCRPTSQDNRREGTRRTAPRVPIWVKSTGSGRAGLENPPETVLDGKELGIVVDRDSYRRRGLRALRLGYTGPSLRLASRCSWPSFMPTGPSWRRIVDFRRPPPASK